MFLKMNFLSSMSRSDLVSSRSVIQRDQLIGPRNQYDLIIAAPFSWYLSINWKGKRSRNNP